MLNQDFGGQGKWPQLTLKQAPRKNQLSRLLPCGQLEQKSKGLACTVFLKRTRSAANSQLLQSLPVTPKVERASRLRKRRGSFLRLASIRNH
jgi:hypothetical protein